MHVLITGGAGFIGSHIVDKLVPNHKIIVYDNFSSGSHENLRHALRTHKENISIVRGDILETEKLMRVMRRVDVILHLAAQLEIKTAIFDPYRDLQTNIVGTLNVLEAMRRVGVKKIIFASSAAVYGEPEKVPTSEYDPKKPIWSYGASKLSSEYYLLVYHNLYNIKFVALRYAIIYGPREWYGRVQTIFIKRAFITNETLVIFGDGNQTRDYLYVEDCAEAHRIILEANDYESEILNLGSGIETPIRVLAKIIRDLSGEDLEIIHEDLEEGEYSKYVNGVWRKPGDLRRMCLDISKIKKQYGWEPVTPLKEGLRREAEWIKANEYLWEKPPRI